MKVGIILFSNKRFSPFLKYYTNILSHQQGVSYQLIFLNRDVSLRETTTDNETSISWIGKGTNKAGTPEKFLNFIHFAIRAGHIIKSKHFDYLIILTTMPAVLLSHLLIRQYSGRYLIDIRDYTHEGFKPYFHIEEQVLHHSDINVISSKGYTNFLPIGEYLQVHNFNGTLQTGLKPLTLKKSAPIIIGYIGSISYESQCLKLISLIETDPRFEFHFFGNEENGSTISQYVNKLNNERIQMHGPFLPEEKADKYSMCDLVFNCYGNSTDLVRYAISNKYYDGALFGVPVLVSPDTAMSELVGDFGFALDLDHIQDLHNLYEWYQAIDPTAFCEYTRNVIEKADHDNSALAKTIVDSLISLKD